MPITLETIFFKFILDIIGHPWLLLYIVWLTKTCKSFYLHAKNDNSRKGNRVKKWI